MYSYLSTFQSPGPLLVSIGPIAIRWYGLLIAIAVILGLNLSSNLAKRRGLAADLISDLLPFLILGGLIGARIYYVSFEWYNYNGENFWSSINFLNFSLRIPRALEIWRGGIAIHGALIGGAISLFFFCRIRKQSFWELLDIIVPSLALGQAIGRWGNFFNQEAFGVPTNLPWKLFIPKFDPSTGMQLRPIEYFNNNYFHPTFLYESLWNILVFTILILLFKSQVNELKRLQVGSLSCIYLISYSLGRVWIEGLRIDPLCLFSNQPFCEGGFRIAQLLSMGLVGLGSLGLWRIFVRKKKLPEIGMHKF